MEPPKTILDTTADFISTQIFGPIVVTVDGDTNPSDSNNNNNTTNDNDTTTVNDDDADDDEDMINGTAIVGHTNNMEKKNFVRRFTRTYSRTGVEVEQHQRDGSSSASSSSKMHVIPASSSSKMHVIPTKLAQMANVPAKKGVMNHVSLRRNNEDDDNINNHNSNNMIHTNDSFDVTLENQLGTLLDIIDPPETHIVVDDGKELSIHTIRHHTENNNIRRTTTTTTTTPSLQYTTTGTDDDDDNDDDDDDEPPTLVNTSVPLSTEELKVEKEETMSPPTSSFTDCICPFPSTYATTVLNNNNDDNNNNDTTMIQSMVNENTDEEMIEEKRSNEKYIEMGDCLTSEYISEVESVHCSTTDLNRTKTTTTTTTSEMGYENTLDDVNGTIESLADNSILDGSNNNYTSTNTNNNNHRNPFSFLSLVIPLSPIPSMNDTASVDVENNMTMPLDDDEEEDPLVEKIDQPGVDRNQDDVTHNNGGELNQNNCIEMTDDIGVDQLSIIPVTPINPPAKWSIFNPFVTSFLDMNRNTDIYGKDPVGRRSMKTNDNIVDDSNVAGVCNGILLDPIGSGPILYTNSIDKSITPPWDREDPPPTGAATTIAAPSLSSSVATTITSNNEKANQIRDIEYPTQSQSDDRSSVVPRRTNRKDVVSTNESQTTDDDEVEDDDNPLDVMNDGMDDVECTMAGPVETIIPTTTIIESPTLLTKFTQFLSLTKSNHNHTKSEGGRNTKNKPSKSMMKSHHPLYNRCHCILLISLLLVGALSGGIYFIVQRIEKSSTQIVAASSSSSSTQVNDKSDGGSGSTPPNNDKNKKNGVNNTTTIQQQPTVSPISSSTTMNIAPTSSPVTVVTPTVRPMVVVSPSTTPSVINTGPDDGNSNDDDESNTNGNDDDGNVDDDGGNVDDDGSNQ